MWLISCPIVSTSLDARSISSAWETAPCEISSMALLISSAVEFVCDAMLLRSVPDLRSISEEVRIWLTTSRSWFSKTATPFAISPSSSFLRIAFDSIATVRSPLDNPSTAFSAACKPILIPLVRKKIMTMAISIKTTSTTTIAVVRFVIRACTAATGFPANTIPTILSEDSLSGE